MKLTLRLSAPYLAVLIFWYAVPNAWLAILAYHIQILFWARHSIKEQLRQKSRRTMLLALPAALAGPLLYYLLPYITHTDLAAWLNNYNLKGLSFILMIPYFGIIHPCLEQIHWSSLRRKTRLSHFVFAGYHLIVLSTLLTVPWLIACFALLTAASYCWRIMEQRTNSLRPAVLSHILADLGIILAAYLSL